MLHLITIFVMGYASVFLLGFQSRNVNHGNYAWAAATSFMIAMSQTSLLVPLIREPSFAAALAYGLSGACGITSSMYFHQRFVKKAS